MLNTVDVRLSKSAEVLSVPSLDATARAARSSTLRQQIRVILQYLHLARTAIPRCSALLDRLTPPRPCHGPAIPMTSPLFAPRRVGLLIGFVVAVDCRDPCFISIDKTSRCSTSRRFERALPPHFRRDNMQVNAGKLKTWRTASVVPR